MRKLFSFFALCSILFLAGCSFGGGDSDQGESKNTENMRVFQGDGYQISYPSDWDIFQKADFTSDIPGNTEVVFRSSAKNPTFITNAMVLKNQLSEPITSEDYGKRILKSDRVLLQNFNLLNQESVSFSTGDASFQGYIVFFEGKNASTDPLLKFVQFSVTDGLTGYIVSSAFAPDEDTAVASQAEKIVRSFVLSR